MGLSNKLSCEAGSFSWHCNPHQCLFPHAGAMGCGVLLASQLFLLVYLHANMGPPAPPFTALLGPPAASLPAPLHNLPPHCFHQPLPCRESSLPSCPSLTLLLVWMNVSSLTTCLSDFLPYSLIFCQFWLFLVFKFVVVLLLVVRGGTVCLPTPLS